MKALLFTIFILAHSIGAFGQAVATVTAGQNAGVAKASRSIPELPPEKKAPVIISKVDAPIVIDGKLDDPAWKTAAVFKDFYQTSPGNNTAPSRPTEAYMMYDEHNLYLAFKCWDERDKIRATVAKRDDVLGEDNVRVWLDTYDDRRRAYVLAFNPLGVQQDGIYTEGNGADFSVDVVMESKGVIEDWGWSVEVKIPFKSLRYTAGKGKFWGINLARNIDRLNDEFDQWMPDDRNVSGFLIKSGKIGGLDGIKYERTLEVVPTITIGETGELMPANLVPQGRFVNRPIKPEVGVTLKYTLSPNVTFDAAINPDFAEIEADAPVVTANQRFPIYFDEKRPFFLEGKEIFDSPLRPFYSRTIVDPDLAAKLTGKVGKTSFGFMAASDNAPGNYSEDERTANSQCLLRQLTDPMVQCPLNEFIGKNATFGVLRLKRDLGKNNNVGFFSTARMYPKNRNYTGGFDGTFKLNDATVMTFQVLGTHSRKNFYSPEQNLVNYRTGNGFGYYWSADYSKDTHGWFAEAFGRTRDYRADAGFTQRTNSNQFFFVNRLSTKSRPKGKFIRVNTNQFIRYTMDWQGRTQYGLLGGNVNMQLQGNLFIYFESGDQVEHIYEEEFGPKRNALGTISGAFAGGPERVSQQPYASMNFNKTVNKQVSIYGFVGTIWGAFDYDFGGGSRFQRVSPAYLNYLTALAGDPSAVEPGLDPGRGRQFDANFGGSYKPIDSLRFSIDYTNSRLRRYDTGKLAYDTNIFSFKSTYQFTRFVFVRTRIDYNTMERNVKGQFLFGWNPNPGTAFYAGYNDDLNYRGYNRFSNDLMPGFERNGRTFFIRASYLFRKSF